MLLQDIQKLYWNFIPIFIEQEWYNLTHTRWVRSFNDFPKGISPKVKVIAWLEFELTCFKASVQHVSPPPPETNSN